MRALSSVLAQTLVEIEVVVVIDGRDDATIAALEGVKDSRVRTLVPDHQLGNADARNAGVSLARSQWIALLDDDDEWLPRKLELQLDTATSSNVAQPIVSCRLISRDERGDRVWPRRIPRAGEDLSEYFFCRSMPFSGEGMVINSGILAPKALFDRVPFTSGLARHVDPDWMLRAAKQPGSALIFPDSTEPLVIWHTEEERARITTNRNWRESLSFCQSNKELFTRRGYAAFVLHVVGSSAAAQGELRAFTILLRESFSGGRPAAVDLVSHVGNFFIPHAIQRSIAGLYERLT
jgi:glycosyltransferase involved in cell wall biosynthesis